MSFQIISLCNGVFSGLTLDWWTNIIGNGLIDHTEPFWTEGVETIGAKIHPE